MCPANQNFSEGDVIYSYAKPFTQSIQYPYLKAVCNTCLKKVTTLFSCRGCKFLLYCSDQCQIEDWKMGHRLECKRFASLGHLMIPLIQELSATFRLMLRILLLMTQDKETVSNQMPVIDGSEESISLSDFLDQQIVPEESEGLHSPLNYEDFAKYSQIITKTQIDPITLKRVCSRVLSGLTVISHDLSGEEIATAIYLSIPKTKYSCIRNSSMVFTGNEMCIRATRSIKNGDEIVMRGLSWPLSLSMADLMAQNIKGFECNCEICKYKKGSNWSLAKDYEELVRQYKMLERGLLIHVHTPPETHLILTKMAARLKTIFGVNDPYRAECLIFHFLWLKGFDANYSPVMAHRRTLNQIRSECLQIVRIAFGEETPVYDSVLKVLNDKKK